MTHRSILFGGGVIDELIPPTAAQLTTHIGLPLLFFNHNAVRWGIRKIIKPLDSFISKTNKILTLLTEEHTGFGP